MHGRRERGGKGAVADKGQEGGEGGDGGRKVAMVVVVGREMVGINCGRSRLIYAQTFGFM